MYVKFLGITPPVLGHNILVKFSTRAPSFPSFLLPFLHHHLSIQLLSLTQNLKNASICHPEPHQVHGMSPIYVCFKVLTYYSQLWPSRAYRPGVNTLFALPPPQVRFYALGSLVARRSDSPVARGSVRLSRRHVLARRSRGRTRRTRARAPPPRTSCEHSAGTQWVVGASRAGAVLYLGEKLICWRKFCNA